MKTSLIIPVLAGLLLSGTVRAQDYTLAVDNPKDARLSLSSFSGNLTIEAIPGNKILISTPDAEDMKVPEKAKGLKPVYPAGTDNTGIGLWVDNQGNEINITCLVPFTKSTDYTIKVPENLALKISSACQNSTDIVITGMKSELEIQNCQDITLKNVSGPLVLSTISGNIDITFGAIATGKPFAINTVSGEIDITLPASVPADISLGTVTGQIYSDFDISDKSESMKQVGGSRLNFRLNGGGTKFNVMNVSGNIYLRKGK